MCAVHEDACTHLRAHTAHTRMYHAPRCMHTSSCTHRSAPSSQAKKRPQLHGLHRPATAGGISGDRTRDLAVLLHHNLHESQCSGGLDKSEECAQGFVPQPAACAADGRHQQPAGDAGATGARARRSAIAPGRREAGAGDVKIRGALRPGRPELAAAQLRDAGAGPRAQDVPRRPRRPGAADGRVGRRRAATRALDGAAAPRARDPARPGPAGCPDYRKAEQPPALAARTRPGPGPEADRAEARPASDRASQSPKASPKLSLSHTLGSGSPRASSSDRLGRPTRLSSARRTRLGGRVACAARARRPEAPPSVQLPGRGRRAGGSSGRPANGPVEAALDFREQRPAGPVEREGRALTRPGRPAGRQPSREVIVAADFQPPGPFRASRRMPWCGRVKWGPRR